MIVISVSLKMNLKRKQRGQAKLLLELSRLVLNIASFFIMLAKQERLGRHRDGKEVNNNVNCGSVVFFPNICFVFYVFIFS